VIVAGVAAERVKMHTLRWAEARGQKARSKRGIEFAEEQQLVEAVGAGEVEEGVAVAVIEAPYVLLIQTGVVSRRKKMVKLTTQS
jgi:hypothetical protein